MGFFFESHVDNGNYHDHKEEKVGQRRGVTHLHVLEGRLIEVMG
jgi:hypothetical protein